LGPPQVLVLEASVLEASVKSRRRGTSLNCIPSSWLRSSRTTRLKSREDCTLLHQCSTGAGRAQASAVGSAPVWAAELGLVWAVGSGLVWAEGSEPGLAVSAARESAPELVPEWAAGSARQAAQRYQSNRRTARRFLPHHSHKGSRRNTHGSCCCSTLATGSGPSSSNSPSSRPSCLRSTSATAIRTHRSSGRLESCNGICLFGAGPV